jgi:phage gp16-like protein
MTKGTECFRYRRQALDAPKANSATRVTLVASELGRSEEDLEGFFYVNREGAKKRHFDYHAFAKKYGVATDWIFDGFLSEHPRSLKRKRQPRRTNSEPMTQKGEIRDAIRGRIREFATARDLSAEDIKPAMTTKHFELVQFAQKYSVSIEWLITGKGRITKTQAEQS